MNRQKIARTLSVVGFTLWLGPTLFVLGALLPAVRVAARATWFDLVFFGLFWTFALGTPAVSGASLLLSQSNSPTRKQSIVQLAVWLLAIVLGVGVTTW